MLARCCHSTTYRHHATIVQVQSNYETARCAGIVRSWCRYGTACWHRAGTFWFWNSMACRYHDIMVFPHTTCRHRATIVQVQFNFESTRRAGIMSTSCCHSMMCRHHVTIIQVQSNYKTARRAIMVRVHSNFKTAWCAWHHANMVLP